MYYSLCLAASHYKKKFEDFDCECEDIKFLNMCFITFEKETILKFTYEGGDGKFEVREGKTLMCTGFIRPLTATLSPYEKPNHESVPYMSSEDFYKELRIRGYHFEGMFKSVAEIKIDASEAKLKWQNNWLTFIDQFAQMVCISKDFRTLIAPTAIRFAIFKPQVFLKGLNESENETLVPVYYIKNLNLIRCEGMEYRGAKCLPIPKRQQPGNLVLQKYEFTPLDSTFIMTQSDAASVCVHLIIENMRLLEIRGVEIDSECGKEILCKDFALFLETTPLSVDISYLTDKKLEEKPVGFEVKKLSAIDKISQIDFIINSNCTNDEEFLRKVEEKLNNGGFLVSRETKDFKVIPKMPENFKFITKIHIESENLFLFKFSKNPAAFPSNCIKISSTGAEKFSWLEKVKESIKTEPIILYSQGESESGILGLVNCIRREPNGSSVKCVFIDDQTAPKFDIENEFYRNQLEKGLAMNVYR